MIGTTVSHYAILEKLGEGGMGVVYKALDTKLDRFVALKFLPQNIFSSEEEIERFHQEAKAHSSLNHPNIATVHDFDEVEGQRFIVLEFLPNGTLKSKIKTVQTSDRQLPVEEVLCYAIEIAEGLAHAHRHGIVHRDLKTDNIMLTEAGGVKITDFGLAKLLGGAHMTKYGSTVGTASCMSPEQVRGEEVDERSDLFSFGVVLYELLTGRLPFRGDHDMAMGYSIVNEDPTPTSSYRAGIPGSLEGVLGHALEKDRTKRFQKATELVSELKKVQLEISGSVKVKKQPSEPTPSIAVLPFTNMSADAENEYFSDGMSEEIINVLTKVSSMRVAARTSSFAFKGKNLDIKTIAQELQVKNVLEGSVRKAGKRVRVTAQLINVADGYHLWSERYDRDLDDVFAIQDEISLAIVDALKIKLLGDEHEALVKRHTENLEAYELYLKGRFSFYKRTVEDIKTSMRYFEQAIALEPNYALPYSGLADALLILSYSSIGVVPPREAFPRAMEAVRRALELDETLAEAHTSLAFAYLAYGWDWVKTEEEFKRAIALNPRYALAHIWYAMFLAQQERHQEANDHARTAQLLEPFFPFVHALAGLFAHIRHENDEAIGHIKKGLALMPNFWLLHIYLGYIYYDKKMYKEASENLKRARVISGDSTYALGIYGTLSAQMGELDEARAVLQMLLQRRKDGYVLPSLLVLLYMELNERDKAIEWCDLALKERDSNLPWFRVMPSLVSLTSDNEIAAILDKIEPEL